VNDTLLGARLGELADAIERLRPFVGAAAEPGQLGDLIAKARAAERHGGNPTAVAVARWDAIRGLHDGRVPVEAIAVALNIEPRLIREHIGRAHLSDRRSDMVELHRQGLHPSEIARRLDVDRRWVRKVLIQHGLTPHRVYKKVPVQAKARAVDLWRRQTPEREISAQTGLTHDQIQDALRSAHRRGELPGYGRRGDRTPEQPT
jgi:hypothetical protein